jgi:bifunctional DNA-binding transcriptional regulator/antitoxin component of YhaV-PrlF toxin-antitoxin module
MVETALRAVARLRRKNQLTLPEPIAAALDAAPDDVLVFETDPAEPGTARIRVVPHGFAGSLTGTYGTTDELRRWLREERGWGE